MNVNKSRDINPGELRLTSIEKYVTKLQAIWYVMNDCNKNWTKIQVLLRTGDGIQV